MVSTEDGLDMEITAITAHSVTVPIVDLDDGGIAPYVTNHNAVEAMDRVLVRVETDAGIDGWGEVRTYLSPAVTETIIEDGVGPHVLGRSPFEVERFRRSVFIEYANADLFFSPVEIACWDIVGKALDRPVYELLGGWTAPSTETRRRDGSYDQSLSVDAAYCLGILPPEESAAAAERARDAGYSVLKTKAGRDWQEDVARVRAMHDAVDGDLTFRLDPNQGWRLDEAVRVAGALDRAGIGLDYLEQPIRVDDHASLATLRQRTTQPIAANEDTYVPHNLGSMIRAGAMDVAVLDMTPLGGISGLRQAAAVCEEANVPFTHHCAFDLGVRTAAIAHAASGIPGFELPVDTTYYAWEDDVLVDPLTITDGAIAVPDGPGLGVDVDPAAVSEYES
jgi:L-alanine-DL-glutamate epimerase-like enolase superfamily enzyme